MIIHIIRGSHFSKFLAISTFFRLNLVEQNFCNMSEAPAKVQVLSQDIWKIKSKYVGYEEKFISIPTGCMYTDI